MGLLGMTDDETMGLAGGLMSAGGGKGFAAGLAGIQAAKQNAIKNRLLEAQMGNYASEIEARKLATVKDTRQQALIESMFNGGGLMGAGGGAASGQSSGGAADMPQPPAMAGQGGAPAGGGTTSSGSSLIQTARKYGIPEQAIQSDMVFNGGKGISAMLEKHGARDMQVSNGYAYDKNNQGAGFMPSLNTSANGPTIMTRIGPDGLPVVTAPQGAVETFGAYKDAEAGREPFKVYDPETHREVYTTKQRAAAAANGLLGAPDSAAPTGTASPPAPGVPKNYLNAIIQTESGGNPNAVSPKGAQGLMQVMPATNGAPGFGVTPARDNSEEERSRVGRDYLTAMNEKYQNPTLAAIAYNMGPGATDRWLASGGSPNLLPKETRDYVASVSTGHAVGDYRDRQTGGSTPKAQQALVAAQAAPPDPSMKVQLSSGIAADPKALQYEITETQKSLSVPGIDDNSKRELRAHLADMIRQQQTLASAPIAPPAATQGGPMAAGPSAAEKAASDAGAGFTKGRAENMVKYEDGLNSRVAEGSNLNMRLQESLKAMENFQNGGGKETRARLGQLAQAFNMPDSVVNGVAGGDLASMQEFNKLAVQQAMEVLKSSMGGAGRIAQAEFKVFQANNPNLDTDSRAVRKIFDFNTRVYQRDIAEQKAFNEHVDAKRDPAKFPMDWSSRSAQQGFTDPNLSAVPGAQSAPSRPVPPAAINDLKMRGPKADAQFDAVFGPGAAARARGGK